MAFPLFAAFTALSGLVSAVGSARRNSAEARAAEAQADLVEEDAVFADRNALLTLEGADQDSRKVRILGRRQFGSMRAAIGASGLTSEGTEDLMAEANAEIEMAVSNIQRQGRLQAQTFREDAKRKRTYAEQLRSGAADIRSSLPFEIGATALGVTASIIDRAPSRPRRGA